MGGEMKDKGEKEEERKIEWKIEMAWFEGSFLK